MDFCVVEMLTTAGMVVLAISVKCGSRPIGAACGAAAFGFFLGFFRFGRAEQVEGVEWRAVRQEQGRQDERDEAEPEASHRHVR